MKIAFFHELPYGGARRAVLEFARELKKNNEVDLFYIDSKKEANIAKIFTSIKFIKFAEKKWNGNNWRAKLQRDTLDLYNLSEIHKRVARVIDEGGYDFVFVHGSKFTQAPFILRYLKTTSLYYCQEALRMVYEDMFDNTSQLPLHKRVYERVNRKVRKEIDRENIKSADILVVNSKYTQKNIKKAYGLSSSVCYMGVDVKRFFPENYKKKYNLLFVGSMDDIDGYSFLQKAIEKMRKKPKVRYLLREKEWISDDKILRKIYCESQLLVCLAYKEPFGLLPIEAQACGIGVVAVSEGGYLDTVKNNQTGFLVKRDVNELASLLARLIKNPKRVGEVSKNAYRQVIKEWTWKNSAENIIKIYREYSLN